MWGLPKGEMLGTGESPDNLNITSKQLLDTLPSQCLFGIASPISADIRAILWAEVINNLKIFCRSIANTFTEQAD